MALKSSPRSCFGVAAHVIILELKEVNENDEPGGQVYVRKYMESDGLF